MNRFGWIVEIDPQDPSAPPVKRTALGRFKHEGIALTEGKNGRVVGYMGDDQRFDYMYKFISADNWEDMVARGESPLDRGVLYVAKFNEDGTIFREPGEPFEGEITWSYQAYPESTWYAPFMSSVERLPNGNSLITNSHNMRIFEITPDGEVVMDFVLEHLLPEELGQSGGRIWRTFKLPPDHAGLAGRL